MCAMKSALSQRTMSGRKSRSGNTYSYAPISQRPAWGRAIPRWSVDGQPLFVPALMAGLPGSSACVGVGPPLFCSGPSNGLVFVRSPLAFSPQVLPLSRLWPSDINAPAAQVPSATMMFRAQIAPSFLMLSLTLVLKVTLVRVMKVILLIPAAYEAVFPLMVVFEMIARLLFSRPPESPNNAALPLMVLFVMVNAPPVLKNPPPSEG